MVLQNEIIWIIKGLRETLEKLIKTLIIFGGRRLFYNQAIKVNCWSSCQDEAQVVTLHFLPQPKGDNNQSKINKQPEVPENQTAGNSNNHGTKETVK